MHGGAIYLRGRVEPYQLGREVRGDVVTESDWAELDALLQEFCRAFDVPPEQFRPEDFIKLIPQSTRPYGDLYAY